MDSHNTFETKPTATLWRIEWGGLLILSAVLAILHWGQIDWAVFLFLFVVIDAVGYIPGAVAFRRSRTHRISKVYYVLYNTMHSLTTWTVILSGWLLWSGWQWAFLAVPLHLLGDRALFGNSLKPFGVSFEPQTHPAFAEFRQQYAAAQGEHRPIERTKTSDVGLEGAQG